jgi:signal transduction histidine kinase
VKRGSESNRINVLVLEDRSSDAELLIAQLREAGFETIWHRVETEKEYVERLDAGWDLIVADYQLPQFDALRALQLLRARELDIPFIIVSGKVGDDFIVEAMKQGAADFLLKDRMARLGIAVEQALERKRMRMSQKEAEQKVRLAMAESERIRSELEAANRALAGKNAQLSEFYQTAQRFVEDVSHEFRTPLTVIKGYAEAIADGLAGPITAQQKEFLGYVSDRTRDLAQMVDDLLDSSKLRAGTMRIDRKRHRAQKIVAHARMMIMAKAAANEIEVVEDIDADLPEVYGDAEKSGRVLVNFAVNAIKFSPSGGRITLWARRTAEGGAEIGVTDQGPGISLENQHLLFERFRQVGDSQNGSAKGFGLGLNIARDLVALNLGQIRLVSSPGQGSTFSFTLPPNDPRIVLEGYMNYLRLLPKRVGTIGILSVECQSPHGMNDNIRDLLTATLQPTDLVLDGPRECSFLLVGYTDDLCGWVKRMRKAAAKFASQLDPSNTRDPIHIDVLGDWPWPAAERQAMAGMMAEFSDGGLIHA